MSEIGRTTQKHTTINEDRDCAKRSQSIRHFSHTLHDRGVITNHQLSKAKKRPNTLVLHSQYACTIRIRVNYINPTNSEMLQLFQHQKAILIVHNWLQKHQVTINMTRLFPCSRRLNKPSQIKAASKCTSLTFGIRKIINTKNPNNSQMLQLLQYQKAMLVIRDRSRNAKFSTRTR